MTWCRERAGWCVDEDAAGSGIRDARRPGTEADSEMRCTVYVGCGEVEHQVRHVGLLCFWSFPYGHLLSQRWIKSRVQIIKSI